MKNTKAKLLDMEDFKILELKDYINCENFNEMISDTRLGKLMKETEDANSTSIIDLVRIVGKSSYYAIRIKSILKEIITVIFNKISAELPDTALITEKIKSVLLMPLVFVEMM